MNEGDELKQQWCNRNSTADGLTAESLIAKEPSADRPEPKFVKRHQLNYCMIL